MRVRHRECDKGACPQCSDEDGLGEGVENAKDDEYGGGCCEALVGVGTRVVSKLGIEKPERTAAVGRHWVNAKLAAH